MPQPGRPKRRPGTWRRFLDPRYQAWRFAVLLRDASTCQICHYSSPTGRGLHVHHRKSYARHRSLRYVVANGITLCRFCHQGVHRKGPRALWIQGQKELMRWLRGENQG